MHGIDSSLLLHNTHSIYLSNLDPGVITAAYLHPWTVIGDDSEEKAQDMSSVADTDPDTCADVYGEEGKILQLLMKLPEKVASEFVAELQIKGMAAEDKAFITAAARPTCEGPYMECSLDVANKIGDTIFWSVKCSCFPKCDTLLIRFQRMFGNDHPKLCQIVVK